MITYIFSSFFLNFHEKQMFIGRTIIQIINTRISATVKSCGSQTSRAPLATINNWHRPTHTHNPFSFGLLTLREELYTKFLLSIKTVFWCQGSKGAVVLGLFHMNKKELIGEVEGSLDSSYYETVLFEILRKMSKKNSRSTITSFWRGSQFV